MDAPDVPPDFSAFLRLLIDHEVEFFILGGFAVAVHGYPRATVAIDVLVSRAEDNAQRVAAAVREFGFETAEPSMFMDPDRLVQMGVVPTRIDILTPADGIEFDDAAARTIVARIGEVEVPVIGPIDLHANKRASGRNKDLADLAELPEPE